MRDETLRLYWCPATRAARGYWMVEELGVDYELVEIDIRADESGHPPDFLAASPLAKVPAISHTRDGVTVDLAESAAICLYLADAFPHTGLAPPIGHPDRGAYLFWMTFVPGIMEPAAFEKLSDSEPNKVSHGWGDFDTMARVLEDALDTGPWLLGADFSAADVMVGSAVHFLSEAGLFPGGSVLGDYVAACLSRPAYQRTLAADDARV